MQQKESLSPRQTAFLLFLLLAGNALILTPVASSGHSLWVSNLLAALVGLYLLALIIAIQKSFPGQSIIKISELCLGKSGGKLISALYVVFMLYATIICLVDTGIIIRTILPLITSYLLRPLLMLVIAFCIYKGLNTAGRLAELFAPLSLALVILSFLVILPVAEPSHLQPILADWKAIVGNAILDSGLPYSSITMLAFFLPFIGTLEKKHNVLYIWYFIGVAVIVIRSVLIMAVLGPDMTSLMRFPLYAALRALTLADFKGIEVFFFILWFISGFMLLLIKYLATTLALKDLLGLPRLNPLILPLGLFITVMSLYMFNSDMEFYPLSSATAPLIALCANLLYPTLVFIGLRVRRKK